MPRPNLLARCTELKNLKDVGKSNKHALRALEESLLVDLHHDISAHDRRHLAESITNEEAREYTIEGIRRATETVNVLKHMLLYEIGTAMAKRIRALIDFYERGAGSGNPTI